MNNLKTISENKIIILIVLAALAISLVHSFYFQLEPIVDAAAYDRIAQNLAAGRGYLEWQNALVQNDFSIARVGPGYEFFLAGVYKIFGHHYWPIWILQAIFHALTVLFVYLTAKEIFKSRWGVLIGISAAALIAFSPDLIVASSMLLTENLAVFLLAACLYFFVRYWRENDWLDTVVLAIFFALAVLVRSQLVLLAIVFFALFLARKDWKKIVIFLAVAVLFFIPWVVRNYQIYKTFIPFNAALGYNLWNGNHPGASGEMEVDYQPLIDYHASHTPLEVNREGIKQFREFVFQRPGEFIELTLKRISIFFSFSRPTGFWPNFSKLQQIITAALSSVYSVLVFTLGFAGMWLAFKNAAPPQKNLLKYFLWLTLMIPLGVIFILVETRYRYPIYPLLAIFGGYAIYCARFRWAEFTNTAAFVFLILLANTLVDFFSNLERIFKYMGIM